MHPSARAAAAALLLASATARGEAPGDPAASACAALGSPPGSAPALEACLGALAVVPTDDPGVRGSLEQARLALVRAAELGADGQAEAADRALRIARAALLVADRRLALARARETP